MPALPPNVSDKPSPQVLTGIGPGQQAPPTPGGADRPTVHSTVDTHRSPPQPPPGAVAPQR
jgi:hypothetical protein